MSYSSVSSCVRFAERMHERIERMQQKEAKLTASADKRTRAPIFTRTRISSGFGKGMVRRDKWVPGMPRITQEACAVVHEYALARAASEGYVGRKSYGERAGISTATLNRCANEMISGKIFLDPVDGIWKVKNVQS
jgi:hypothetical protein